jgi:hypothetical protein
VLAVLTPQPSLRKHGKGLRLRLQDGGDYAPVQLAAISKQAIPVFTGEGGETGMWVFQGFFRFGQPTGKSAACCKVALPPPELEELRKRNDLQ